ncbi:MAG: hypothetical protein AAB838_04020 [Patescibacteria group bacterium]
MNSQKGNILIIIPSIIAIAALVMAGYFFFQNQQLQKPKVEIPVVNNEVVDWKTYNGKGFEFKYPDYLTIVDKNSKVSLVSSPIICATSVSGSPEKVTVSDVDITIEQKTGTSFENIWKNVFGFDFNDKNYDGTMLIGNKDAFYFYQGAENPQYRKAILVKIDSTKAVELNIYSPGVVYDCTPIPSKNQDLVDQILGTFRFLN